MSRSLRRGAVAALIIATAPILAACAAGDSAATLQVKPDHASTSITANGAALKLNDIVVVTDPAGSAPANVTVNIANGSGDTPETLTGVTVDGVAAVITGDATVPALGSLRLGSPGQPSATVPTLTATTGQNATVVFTFDKAGQAQTLALVTAGTGEYASYAPSPSPTPTPSPTVTPVVPGGPVSTATSTAKPKSTATAKKP